MRCIARSEPDAGTDPLSDAVLLDDGDRQATLDELDQRDVEHPLGDLVHAGDAVQVEQQPGERQRVVTERLIERPEQPLGGGELQVPLLKDKPFFRNLELSGAARITNVKAVRRLDGLTDKNTGNWTYKVGANWAVSQWLRFRGTVASSRVKIGPSTQRSQRPSF